MELAGSGGRRAGEVREREPVVGLPVSLIRFLLGIIRRLEGAGRGGCKLVEINHLEATSVRLVQQYSRNVWIQRNYSAKLIPAGLRVQRLAGRR